MENLMGHRYRALIVDDERLARKDLRSLLADHPIIEVVGEADSVKSAAELLQSQKPDLIFLDVQMPGESGFDLLEKYDVQARVIFVTAFDEYALRAFDVEAMDYLLKPVSPERLRQSIERLGHHLEASSENRESLKYADTMFLTLNNHLKFIRVSSIVCIQAAADYTELFLTDARKGLTAKTMAEWESRLPANHFCRIHRGTIINLEHVRHIEEWFGNSYRITLDHLTEPVTMSRRYAARLKERMG
jgi:two-component system LytT family response regulator